MPCNCTRPPIASWYAPNALARCSPFAGNEAFHLDHFQILCCDSLQLPERVRVPALHMGTDDKEVTAVVSEEHSVLFQRQKNNPRFRTKARKIVIGFQPHPHAHWRQIFIVSLACPMAGGWHLRPACLPECEPESVLNGRLVDALVIADEARKDRQPSRIGGRPLGGTNLVLRQVPYRAAVSFPAGPAKWKRIEEFVQDPRVAVEDDNVPVAFRPGAALDRRVRRDRVGAWITFIGDQELDRHFRLIPSDDDVRNADRSAFPFSAEIRVKPRV